MTAMSQNFARACNIFVWVLQILFVIAANMFLYVLQIPFCVCCKYFFVCAVNTFFVCAEKYFFVSASDTFLYVLWILLCMCCKKNLWVQTWYLSFFSTNVLLGSIFLQNFNFQFPHNCHTWKAEICPHDNFFSTNILVILVRNIRSRRRYQLWFHFVLIFYLRITIDAK